MARPTRRGDASPQDLYQLGVQGRKTGATLKDDGQRDSQGMMPTEGLFSSPGSSTTQQPIAAATEEPIREVTPPVGGNDDESAPMDIASSGGAGPGTVLRNSRNFQLPLSKGRSPIQPTARLLRSPAKRPPSKSPMRPSATDPTARHIFSSPSVSERMPRRPSIIREPPSDDSINALLNQSERMGDRTGLERDYRVANEYRPEARSPQPAGGMSAKAIGKQRAVPSMSPPRHPPVRPSRLPTPSPPAPESSMYVHEPDPDPGPEPDLEPEPEPEPRRHSSSPSAPIREPSIPTSSPRLQTHKRPTPAVSTTSSTARRARDEEDDRRDGAKRVRQTDSVVSKRSAQPAKRGRGRPPKNGVAKRGRGRPRRSEVESDGDEGDSLMTLQRGPPMPKSRGLVSMRRDADAAVENRRRGNDADWWADIQNDDTTHGHEPPRGQRLASQAATKHQRRADAAIPDVEEDLEDWELDTGSFTGEIVVWEPEYEHNPPGPDDQVEVTDEVIALTADAIPTFEIRESDARYAKPLVMPFMSAGFVDLPSGSEKRPKNSRKMHLVFFVHYGKVTVSINEEQFRISTGGMWFVPRGNYYNIANDYEFPARVYFAQACEVSPSPQPVDDMTQTIVT
ncbi:cupin domain-containing protein [Cordyceps militaris CM01]|uniref:CENP-C homolog n=1 Tax=Cordyceps militaris (strain CM01) TaxID=983644 RepID=G3JEN7_CORMM|nr:cupin domain-containing protein [Cordyceps militaris CM01]EGX93434.1 cupin domain-containing protein [Cordyceps militaris CM01]